MKKKTLILSQKQLDEICGGDSSYLDNLSLKPDMGNIYANEITVDGSVEDGYAEPSTTDDLSHTMCNNWRGFTKLYGMGPVSLKEMTKKEWARQHLNEESEHGNARLVNKKFGAQDGEPGKSYDATKMAISRKKQAEKKMLNGATPEERNKAAKTLSRMRNNWNGIDAAESQYNAAKIGDKVMQDSRPEGTKISSAPKQSGNGKAHSPKSGIITYQK